MIKELLDGLTSRLKGIGEKGGGMPPAGGIPPAAVAPAEAAAPAAPSTPPAPSTDDFSALLGGGDTSELDNKVKALEEKTNKLESTVRETLELTKANKSRLDSIDSNMKKFLSLYELVTNQINPFVDSKSPFKQRDLLEMKMPEPEKEEKIVMPAEEKKPEPVKKKAPVPEVPVLEEAPELAEPPREYEEPRQLEQPRPQPAKDKVNEEEQIMFMQSVKDGSASFVMEWITSLVSEDGGMEKNTKLLKYLLNLGWITPKAYEALMQHMAALAQAGKMAPRMQQMMPMMVGPGGAGGMPMQNPKGVRPMQIPSMPFGPAGGSGDSLLTVLEWVKYLVDKVGYQEATDILKYLVQLEWITPEAHGALLKYIEKSTPEGALSMPKAQMPSMARPQSKVLLSPTNIPSPEDFMRSEYRVQVQGGEPVMPQPVRGQEQFFPQPQYQAQPQYPPQYQAPKQARRPPVNAIIPLAELGSDIDSLAIVLEWIRYMVDRAGTQGAKDIFGYYQNIGWVEQRVCQQLIKYVDGIKAAEEEAVGYQPTVEDHATSLFFISKLKRMELSEDDINSMLGN